MASDKTLDKLIEADRYTKRAQCVIDRGLSDSAYILPEYLKPPYELYRQLIAQYVKLGDRVLELGAGTGEYSDCPLDLGAKLVANDISLASLKVLENRFKDNSSLETCVFDMESIPYVDEHFDHVICAGSLSYGDWKKVCAEIFRVLKPGGVFILVDVYNHNVIYKANRFLHWLKSDRTKSVIDRAPSIKLLNLYRAHFSLDVYYHGSMIYLAPLIAVFFGAQRARRFIEITDKIFQVEKSAFRIVFVAKKEF